jgi:Mannosyl oligosaccharide glucosidase.
LNDNFLSEEHKRLSENSKREVPIEKWGPYLSERQWGTVREDYSPNQDAWNYLTHDQSRSRAYLWGEDGLGGISDYFQNLCFSVAVWNGKDPILKERLFGLTNSEGNHGEDVKELYYYLDNIPSHYYMKFLYKYPQVAYPYNDLIEQNKLRSKNEAEYELLDTGIFNNDEYFDLYFEYAKVDSEDIFIKIEIINRGNSAATITVLPTLWFYNRWQYGGLITKPFLEKTSDNYIHAWHERLGDYYFYYPASDQVLMTENETNFSRLNGRETSLFVKDSFHTAIIDRKGTAELSANQKGTKVAPVYTFNLEGGGSTSLILRISNKILSNPFKEADVVFNKRKQEADEYYDALIDNSLSADLKNIVRQAYSGLLWSKQYYHLDNERWLTQSDGITPYTESRKYGRNHDWKYLKNQDIISMPDKWEYPWYAAWDSAFHCIALARLDPSFAKNQLLLLMKEWYMNPEGQLPAYEWNFNDVNPPVHAFAALKVYQIEKEQTGSGDIEFLKRIFQKLIINFTWWANRKDKNDNNIFEGGFLGLDNIGAFDRSILMPDEVELQQADGTSWMGMFALNMMDIALELSKHDIAFEDAAIKFYEHFVIIAEALNEMGLWNEEDLFFYDVLCLNNSKQIPIKIRSLVGLVPLYGASVIRKKEFDQFKEFKKRSDWLKEYRRSHNKYVANEEKNDLDSTLVSMIHKEKLTRLVDLIVDETEFLSDHGVRSLSKFYKDHPINIQFEGLESTIHYDPADSTSGLYGGNSNWRGPVWMPVNYLMIQALKKYGEFYMDDLTIEFPRGSGLQKTLTNIADELSKRIIKIFTINEDDERICHGKYNWFYKKTENKDLVLFYEYFHGDLGYGLGASHQTGWTALVANLVLNSKT